MALPVMNVMVKRIGEVLNESNKPLTVTDIARELEVTPQTVRNHIPTAIEVGFVRQTEYRVGKAYTYESAHKQTSLLPTLIWGDAVVPLRDKFIEFSKTGLPREPVQRKIGEVIYQLYFLTATFYDPETSSEFSYPARVTELKKQKAKIRNLKEYVTGLLAILNSLHSNEDLWDPKTLIKAFMVKDDDMDLEFLRSILDRYTDKESGEL